MIAMAEDALSALAWYATSVAEIRKGESARSSSSAAACVAQRRRIRSRRQHPPRRSQNGGVFGSFSTVD